MPVRRVREYSRTGNWAEHLMRTDWLAGVLREEGFEVDVLGGYWSSSSASHKQLVKSLLNLAIKTLGTRALFRSPYSVLYAENGA